ncbi:TIGR04282 family arsenosugar biosynthesis glycosyltransferase [Gillisia sp. Hel_I_29]|uniref:TIGR04282 family arsenosugar biosynthesis glycosyltransferase n=1 Tax=Gillisia sp. Hel_I_29 TaxID=1249975 RepID=UPI00054D2755|nr:TIGR04282 family arsenosugar biosynthesis glycosyltransferase [Gillisia sp. Hel_I_29]
MKSTSKNLLLIFTRNPELGKVKTRLAKDVGDETALEIYKFLIEHTVNVTKDLSVEKEVHYSVKIRENDLWDNTIFSKKLQQGEDLGERMQYAFEQGFKAGYQNIIIIGSDLYDLNKQDIEEAIVDLQEYDAVVGPAEDGGYYLLGMNFLTSQVFKNKNWGTDSVLQDTLKDLKYKNVKLLEPRNDVDYLEDIQDVAIFQKFLKK